MFHRAIRGGSFSRYGDARDCRKILRFLPTMPSPFHLQDAKFSTPCVAFFFKCVAAISPWLYRRGDGKKTSNNDTNDRGTSGLLRKKVIKHQKLISTTFPETKWVACLEAKEFNTLCTPLKSRTPYQTISEIPRIHRNRLKPYNSDDPISELRVSISFRFPFSDTPGAQTQSQCSPTLNRWWMRHQQWYCQRASPVSDGYPSHKDTYSRCFVFMCSHRGTGAMRWLLKA